MRNDLGIFNSQSYINEYIRDVLGAPIGDIPAPELGDESMVILDQAQRNIARFHEGENKTDSTILSTREQLYDLLARLAKVEPSDYPAALLEARRELFIAQINQKDGHVPARPSGS
jgi:hypothetical protein